MSSFVPQDWLICLPPCLLVRQPSLRSSSSAKLCRLLFVPSVWTKRFSCNIFCEYIPALQVLSPLRLPSPMPDHPLAPLPLHISAVPAWIHHVYVVPWVSVLRVTPRYCIPRRQLASIAHTPSSHSPASPCQPSLLGLLYGQSLHLAHLS